MKKQILNELLCIILIACNETETIIPDEPTTPIETPTEQEAPVIVPPTVVDTPIPAEPTLSPYITNSLTRHNEIRKEYDLPYLTWDPDLADKAQKWVDSLEAEGCKFYHNPDRGHTGENLAMGFATSVAAIDAWLNERIAYDTSACACQPGAVCGHFTQLIWESTLYVGCGYNEQCGIFGCNYSPPGNYIGQCPF